MGLIASSLTTFIFSLKWKFLYRFLYDIFCSKFRHDFFSFHNETELASKMTGSSKITLKLTLSLMLSKQSLTQELSEHSVTLQAVKQIQAKP